MQQLILGIACLGGGSDEAVWAKDSAGNWLAGPDFREPAFSRVGSGWPHTESKRVCLSWEAVWSRRLCGAERKWWNIKGSSGQHKQEGGHFPSAEEPDEQGTSRGGRCSESAKREVLWTLQARCKKTASGKQWQDPQRTATLPALPTMEAGGGARDMAVDCMGVEEAPIDDRLCA